MGNNPKNLMCMSDMTFDNLIFKLPLYKKVKIICNKFEEKTFKIDIDEQEYYGYSEEYKTYYPEEFQKLIDFLGKSNKVYGKCIECHKEMVFEVKEVELNEKLNNKCIVSYCDTQLDDDYTYIPEAKDVMRERINILTDYNYYGYFEKEIKCTMCGTIYKMYYKVEFNEESGEVYLQKTGQYPCLNAISEYNANKYQKLLKKMNALDDLRSGYRLQLDGFNIGAYTYLRRVLEKFIIYKFDSNKENLEISFEEFKCKHMDEKLQILKNYLPNYLFKNQCVYNVVSAGIHALGEKECGEYFSIIQNVIELMLNEEETARNREKLKKITSNNLSNINTKIANDLKRKEG